MTTTVSFLTVSYPVLFRGTATEGILSGTATLLSDSATSPDAAGLSIEGVIDSDIGDYDYIVNANELWLSIANRFYGNPEMLNWIYLNNPHIPSVYKRSLWAPKGYKLKLPPYNMDAASNNPQGGAVVPWWSK